MKFLLTVAAVGGWVMMLVQPMPNLPAITVGLFAIAAGIGLSRIAKYEAEMRRKEQKRQRLQAPATALSLPMVPRPPLVRIRRGEGDLQKLPQQRWHRSGGRVRRVAE